MEQARDYLFAIFFDCTKKVAERNAAEIEMCNLKEELRVVM